jgi:hypothetical protein
VVHFRRSSVKINVRVISLYADLSTDERIGMGGRW